MPCTSHVNATRRKGRARAFRGSPAAALLLAACSTLGLGCERVREALARLTGEPVEGASCKSYVAKCTGPKEALVCIDGKYVRRACQDAAGCTTDLKADTVACFPGEGQRCSREEEGTGLCTSPPLAMLTCQTGTVRSQPCRGAERCESSAAAISCDTSVGKKGEACPTGISACSIDGTEQLRCEAGVFVSAFPCRGAKGCKVGEDIVDCDRSAVFGGDPCEPKDEGSGACSSDGLSRFECKGGKFVETFKCRGPGKCAVTAAEVTCDSSVGAPGDPCYEDGASCSEDGKHMLSCKGGQLALDRACKSCATEDGFVSCR